MILYVVRHGIAIDRADPNSPPEIERYLTREGIKKTREVAEGVHALGARPTVFISSPYVRAMQTAQIFAEVFEFSRDKIRESAALKPGGSPAEFVKELAHVKAREVAAFGHAPNLDQLIGHLVGARGIFTALKKAGVAALEFDSPSAAKATLAWLLTPKVLRHLDT
ncbi:MAG: histidine phosphatase family protein [Candidatus Acidiferrales bacterium]